MMSYWIAGGVAAVVAIVGGLATDVGDWYRELNKPTWNPPDWLFAPAWTAIYALATYAAGSTWNSISASGQGNPWLSVALPFLINAVLNAAWSVFFFSLKRPDWALIEVGLLWLSTATLPLLVYQAAPTAAWALVPYVLWVSFAALLNGVIVRMN
ncbi:MAG: TspO/MBR family protein [Pseudomonadota bacterium]